MGQITHDKKIKCSAFVRFSCYNSGMTGKTRDYLADLANKKGVSLPNEQERDQAWASAKIDELNQLPDASFNDFTPAQAEAIQKRTNKVLEEMSKWTFQE